MSKLGDALNFEFVRRHLNEHLEPRAHQYIDGALAGDLEAAGNLVFAASNPNRGIVAVGLYLAKVPNPAFRQALSDAWDHDHGWVIASAGSRNRLMAMFRRGKFPLPEGLPDAVPIWRGVANCTRVEAAMGYSWTLDRDLACWFAMRFAKPGDSTLVLKRTVRRADLVYYSNDRAEQEVVPAKFSLGEMDGDVSDWAEGMARENAKRKAC